MTATYLKLFNNIEKIWPTHTKKAYKWELGKIKDELPDFSVIEIQPIAINEPWTYITHGAWEIKTQDEAREYYIHSPEKDPIHVETLTMLASFLNKKQAHLKNGETIDIGRGWLKNSLCHRLMASTPYTIPPNEKSITTINNKSITYSWLLPIHDIEYEILKKFGLDYLETLFENAEIDYLDPTRPALSI